MKFNYSSLTVALMLAFGSASTMAETGDTPPNPKPGECYARVYVAPESETTYEEVLTKEATQEISVTPAVYGTEQKTVLVREASKKLVVVPATYKTVTESVEIKPATTKLEVVPATYKTVTETIEIKPATTKLEVVPATYGMKTERVLVKEASTQWKRGRAWLGKAIDTKSFTSNDGSIDDEVMCLVEVPAVYKDVTTRVEVSPATTKEVVVPAEFKTVTKTVVDTPATTKEVVIPAEYKTITKTVVDTPETTKEIEVPAEYKTVSLTKVVTPAQETITAIPAVYDTVAKTTTTTEGRHEWRSILCETNATPATIKQLQQALFDAGFPPGPIDGIIRNQTMSAVNAYQKAKDLPVDPYINMETVKSLGL